MTENELSDPPKEHIITIINYFLLLNKNKDQTVLPAGEYMAVDCKKSALEDLAYNGLEELGYPPVTVNHSKNFVDPNTGCHTQMIGEPSRGD